MKLRYAYTLPALAALLILSGFSSEGTYFPAPIKEPVAAVYLNVSSTGIYDESSESEKACTEITDTVNNICNLRSISNNSEPTQKYKELSLNFLQNSIISGFLKIEELFFYYKNQDEYALIANGSFNLDDIAAKTKAVAIYNENNEIIKISSAINTEAETTTKQRLFMQAVNDTIIICPENNAGNIIESIENNQNLLGEKFKTFEQMVKFRPAIGAEINLEEVTSNKSQKSSLPQNLAATNVIRLLVATRQNKLQINIPKEEDRQKLKEELAQQIDNLNAMFDNKTDYKLTEGKTSLFFEAKANKEQMQSVSRKAMAFMLHFFVKNIPSDQQ